MTPERWQRVKKILEESLAREASARVAYLEGACAGDDDLKRDVESFLAHERPDDFLEHPAIGRPPPVPDSALAGPVPDRNRTRGGSPSHRPHPVYQTARVDSEHALRAHRRGTARTRAVGQGRSAFPSRDPRAFSPSRRNQGRRGAATPGRDPKDRDNENRSDRSDRLVSRTIQV